MFPRMGDLPPALSNVYYHFTTFTVKIRLILAGIKEGMWQQVISKLVFKKDKMSILL